MGGRLEQNIVFIHGFLGQPSDWQAIEQSLLLAKASFHFLDLNRDFSISELNFQSWPEAFLNWTKKKKITGSMCLVGYSMGGRLICPLLEKNFAKKAIFLSSQFGFHDEDLNQRSERRLFNQNWAQKFLHQPWVHVMEEWHHQAIFKNSVVPTRNEGDFDRQKLAASLTGFSMSEQKDFSNLWQRKDLSLLYLVGENDLKYRVVGEELQQKAINTKVITLKNSGHRLLLDQPQLVAQEISKFINVND